MKHLQYIYRYLLCQWCHKRHHNDVQWELTRIPSDGLICIPALWRVWTTCRKCGVGWTRAVEMASSGIKPRDPNKPLPMIEDCTFHSVDGKNLREK